MKQFLLAKADDATILVEWDVEAGWISIKTNGNAMAEHTGIKLKQGITDVDIVDWAGQRLRIMRHVHNFFLREYPTIDLQAEYLKADEWAVRKDRVIKNAQAFMSNWLKKAVGGNHKRGGVIY